MRKSHARELVSLRNNGRDVDEILRELYVERGYNFSEIGLALGVSRELVRKWVDAAGLREQRPAATEAVA